MKLILNFRLLINFYRPIPLCAASRSDRNGKSQQRPDPTGKTVSTSRALLRHPSGTLLQVTDTVPEKFRRHQVPTPLFVHSLNKGPLVATPVGFTTPFPRPDSRPPDTVRSAKATPAVWRPTTAPKRDWRSRHTATDPSGVKSRDVTAASDRHIICVPGVGSGVWDVVPVFPVDPVCLFGGGAMTSSLKERFFDFAAHG
jgi:hypothetical protein